MKLASLVLRHTWLYQLAGRLAAFAMRWTPRFLIYHRFNTWGKQREMPSFSRKSFRRIYRERNRHGR
jgi:L-lactate dehydrogenase complex protein LldF